MKERREEPRRAARSQIEAVERRAAVRIEMLSLDAEMRIAKDGLTSEAALTFLATLPSIKDLLPALSYDEVAGEADPPVLERLMTPSPLRQRRFRGERRSLGNNGSAAETAAGEDGNIEGTA